MEQKEVDSLRLAVGAVLRAERGRIDISQDELAERSQLSKSTITRIESGVREPSLHQIHALASAFGRSGSWLVGQIEAELATFTKVNMPPSHVAKLDQLSAKRTERKARATQGRKPSGDA